MTCAVPDSPEYEPVIGIDYWPLDLQWMSRTQRMDDIKLADWLFRDPKDEGPVDTLKDHIRTVLVREYAWWQGGCSWRFGYDLESDTLFVESPGAVDL